MSNRGYSEGFFVGDVDNLEDAPNPCLVQAVIDPETKSIKIKDEEGETFTVSGGEGSVQQSVKTLTNAEVLDLHNTPVEILAQQPVGVAIIPTSIQTTVKHNGTDYAFVGAVRVADTGGTVVYAQFTADSITSDNDRISSTEMIYAHDAQVSMPIHKGVMVFATSPITLGDGDVTYSMSYKTVKV